MEGIIIKEIVCNGNRVDIDFSVSDGLEDFFLPEHHFFAEYSCDISDVPNSVLVVPLLSNILQFSWLVDCVVWVNEIDKNFYDAIPKIKYAFREMYPDYSFKGTLIPAKLVENSYIPQQQSITLFTGGIDATTTFLRHLEEKPVLLNTNGWYEKDVQPNEVYNADKTAIEEIADQFRVSSCFVRSNFARFLRAEVINKHFHGKVHNSWWRGFQHSLAFLGCAAVAGYHYRVANLYIGSSHTFGEYANIVSDPRIDNCFAVSSMTTTHDAYEMSRQDKVHYILETQRKLQKTVPLRVCSFNAYNCCGCEKCMRSMLAILAEGGDVEALGFHLPDTFLNTLKRFLKEKITELDSVHILFWFDIIKRMEENYDQLVEKEVYHYLSNFDFKKARRDYLWSYYTKNFWEIIKRKLGIGRRK